MSDDRIYMLNALWFKKDGGAETYRRYAAATQPILAELGARPLPAYRPEGALIGDFDADLVFFVEYPNEAAFKALLEHPAYAEIRHLREEAIEKSMLVRCSPVDLRS